MLSNVRKTTFPTPEGSVSAFGWFWLHKICPSKLLSILFISIAALGLGCSAFGPGGVPRSRPVCALMIGCLLALLILLWSGGSSTYASKAGPNTGHKRTKRTKKNKVTTRLMPKTFTALEVSGWLRPYYLLRLFGNLSLLCLGTVFAHSSAATALLYSQWCETPASFPAVTKSFTPASQNGFHEAGGNDTFLFADIVTLDSVARAADHLGEHEGSWRDGLMEDIKDVVGEPLHLVGGLMVSVKNDYEKPDEADLETVQASRNNTERKGEPNIDSFGPIDGNSTGIIARWRDTVLFVDDAPLELRPANAGRLGKVRKLVETGFCAGASMLLGRLVSRMKMTASLVRVGAAALLISNAAASPSDPPPAPPPSPPAAPGATYDIVTTDELGRRRYPAPAASSESVVNAFSPADCNSTWTGCVVLPRSFTAARATWAGTLHTSPPICSVSESGARSCDDGLPALPQRSDIPVHGEGLSLLLEQLAEAEDLPGGSENTRSAALGDVNGDGRLDIVFANAGAPNQLLLGKSTGGFVEAAEDLPGGSENTRSAALGDVNGDGRLDIVFANYNAPNQLLLGKSTGGFVEAAEDLPGGSKHTFSAALGDVNGDGRLDIVFANSGAPNQLLLGTSCPSGGAQLHGASWCFRCPNFMGRPTLIGAQLSVCLECLPDFVQQPGIGELCATDPCPLGKRPLGSDACSPCRDKQGVFYNTSVAATRTEDDPLTLTQPSCVECPTGSFANGVAVDECFACPTGSYQDLIGQAECKRCPVGEFQPERGQTSCHRCATGGYCDDAENCGGGFTPCPAGTFNDQRGSSSLDACSKCPRGTSSPITGASSRETCASCRAGTFGGEPGRSECMDCPPGSYSNPGSHSCDQCAAGTYAANPGQGECTLCPHPLSSKGGDVTCSICKEGFYLIKNADPADIFRSPTDYCKPCPPNAECSDGTTLETLDVPPGYWRASTSSAVLTACRDFGGDSAGVARCAGSKRGANQAARFLEEAGSDEYCATGFTGPECQLCVADKHHLVEGDKCDECLSVGAATGQIAAIALTLCVVCGLAVWAFMMKKSWRQKTCIGPPLRFADLAFDYYLGIGMTAKIKILFGFYQVCLVLSTTYSARLPDEYTDWTDKLARAVAIDWSGVLLPAQCLPYTYRLIAVAVSPVGLIALVLFAGMGCRLYHWRVVSAPRARSWYAEAALGLLDLTPAGLVIVFCFVPSVSAAIFRSWSCQAYTISPPGAALKQIEYMRQDASVRCDSNEHDGITSLAIVFLVIWPLGSLALYSSLLIACRKPLQGKTPNTLTRATAFLHREYVLTYFWWEALELARKLVLTGAVLLIPEERAFLRLAVATLICSWHVALVAATKPYKRVEDNVIAVATSLVLLLFFLGANWTTIFLGIEEHYQGADPADVLGFGKLNGIVDAMIALVAAVLVIFLVGAIVAAHYVAKVPTIRLVSTNQPPELSIVLGLKWHLFNSHIWSTGQDAVSVIKKQLMLLLPDIKVFLDVDDLEDIGALEEYIAYSQMILIFLSQGYFRSKNCLREVRTSLDRQKPLVLVQEVNPEKGGGTLQALRAECPPDLQPDVFEKGWRQVPWHRIAGFQTLSLKMIAEALLLCSPNYDSLDSLDLCIPNEARIQSLTFAKKVVVRVSQVNAGAEELANELANTFADITVSTAEDADGATHMLLYLNESTWSRDEERLLEQVKAARAARLPIVLAHENDPALGGCPFARLFETTPQELIAAGLYKDVARACFPGLHHEVSLVLLAKSLGATTAHSVRQGILRAVSSFASQKVSFGTPNGRDDLSARTEFGV